MKESYNEGVASHIGPESCLDDPRGRGNGSTGYRSNGYRVHALYTHILESALTPNTQGESRMR